MIRDKYENVDVFSWIDHSESLGHPMQIVPLVSVANLRKNVRLHIFCSEDTGGASLDAGENVLRRNPVFAIVYIN